MVMTISTRRCVFCGENGTLEVPVEGVRAYENGAFVQDAFPDLPAAEREQIISGTHPTCWAENFGDPEAEPCEICKEEVTFCSCWRCMECENLYPEDTDAVEDADGEQFCPRCAQDKGVKA